ncbi:hypothetical protein EZS27_004680 [termite gut metagenome]|uniref:Uncharacterized protein n=1 Tax=termite gut metagenome TaxID=433724 RepID=A0A5J4SRT0_9ZZZZ
MNRKIYQTITDIQRTTRISNKGRIESPGVFSLTGFVPFSVYLRPLSETDSADELIACRLLQEDEASLVPVGLGDWCPLSIIELEVDSNLLQSYELYWGAGGEAAPIITQQP